MSNIESELIQNPGNAEKLPFWPEGQTRLIIILEILDDRVIARGLDPDKDEAVFRAVLSTDQPIAFVAAAKAGLTGTLIDESANENLPVDPRTVVIGPPGGGDTGPKFRIALAVSVPAAARATGTRR